MLKRILSLLLLGILIIGCENKDKEMHKDKHGEEQHEEAGSEEIILTKKVQQEAGMEQGTAELSSFSGIISVPAKVISNQNNEAFVGSLIKGRVKKIYVNLGTYVKEGTPLFSIEGLEIGNIKSEFLKAKTALSIAKGNLERQQTLQAQNAGSLKALQEKQGEYENANAEYESAHQKVHSLGLTDYEVQNISDNHISGTLVIKAPISGIITERNIILGQVVNETDNAIRILNTSSLWIEGDLPENELSKIVNSTNIIFVNSASPETEYKGELFYVSPGVDAHTRTIKIRATVKNQNNMLKPESFGTMNISINREYKGIVIPDESLIQEGDKTYIFIMENDTIFKKKEIIIGKAFNGNVEVKEGLSKGTKYVTKGVVTIKAEALKESFGHDH